MKLLKMVAVGALIIGMGAAPSPRAMGNIFRELRMTDTPRNRRWIKRRLKALHERRYVEMRDDSNSLSELGQRMVDEERLWELAAHMPKQWDGLWHLVVFDIPKERSHTRIPFVRLLQHLGFVYYQRSIWIHPYDCVDEVRTIALHYDIIEFVSFIIATQLDGSHEYRKHFKLSTH
jgi:DNA-binding transcriptional regulator PaaX